MALPGVQGACAVLYGPYAGGEGLAWAWALDTGQRSCYVLLGLAAVCGMGLP